MSRTQNAFEKWLHGGGRGVFAEEIGISKSSYAHIALIQVKFPLKESPYSQSVHDVDCILV